MGFKRGVRGGINSGAVFARASAIAVLLALGVGASAGGAGCGSPPKAPAVECHDDGACGDVPRRMCQNGRCEAREGYCDERSPCPGGRPCTENQCGSAVASGEPVMIECDDDHPCAGKGQRCQNGHCVAPQPGGPGCRDFGAPTFEFDSPELSATMKETLTRLAKCMSGGSLAGRKVLLTGHCDPRGENEYNMGLGATRSEAGKAFLVTLGVPEAQVTTSSRGKLDAIGSEESTWKQDRRVDIEVR